MIGSLSIAVHTFVSRDTDYADDIALVANTLNQAETLLHNLERAAAGIGLHVNAHKTEYMCYNQTDDISTLDGTSLKLVDKFPYLESSVSSTEKDIDTRLTVKDEMLFTCFTPSKIEATIPLLIAINYEMIIRIIQFDLVESKHILGLVWFLCLMVYQLILGYLMPKPFS